MSYAAVFPLLSARALTEPFDYGVPETLAERVGPGSLVAVPLGRQTVLGVVLSVTSTTAHRGRILPLRDVVDMPGVPAELLEVAARVRRFYLTSLGNALALVTPPASAVRLVKTVSLTPAGREALQAGEESLVPFADATKVTPTLRPLIERYRRKGWLSTEYSLHVIGQRKARYVALGQVPGKRMGARQRAAVRALERAGVLDEGALRAASQISPAAPPAHARAGLDHDSLAHGLRRRGPPPRSYG